MPTGVYPRTEYHRLVRSGWKHSDESKNRMSATRKGRVSPFKGKTHTLEWKSAKSVSMLGNTQFPEIPWNKGKGIYPNGRDPVKVAINREKYKKLGLLTLYQRNTRAKRKLAIGTFSSSEWLKMKASYRFTCPACKKKEPEIKLSIDHIQPLSKGGSNFADNIQPLCYKCNVKKHTRTIKYEK